jgi:hypothetical protein
MTARRFPIFLLAVAGAALAGCAEQSSRYAPEPSLTPQNSATLYGSREPYPLPLIRDARNYILAVDDKPTGLAPFTWDTPLLVSAGPHAIRIARSHGSMEGSVSMQVALESGKSYAIRSEGRDRGYQASIWIEEQESGAIVGDKVTMCLNQKGPIFQLITPCK